MRDSRPPYPLADPPQNARETRIRRLSRRISVVDCEPFPELSERPGKQPGHVHLGNA